MSNKVNNCCNCPPSLYLMRLGTEYGAQSIVSKADMTRRNIKSVHEYNNFLETHGYNQMKSNFSGLLDASKLLCDPNNRKIIVDSSNYHKYFEQDLESITSSEVVPFDNHVETRVLSTFDKPNYNSKYITSDRPLHTRQPVASKRKF